ncbi:MAG TPA: hypothetical protein PLS03_13920 [Terrimicrobiaceae bacterium]|nr:hypothetical protein [Terrimicrobiaceae bacterium]
MKFNPLTKSLFTDDARLIKQLHCPFRVDWRKLKSGEDSSIRRCDICQHSITDTAFLTDAQLLGLMSDNPESCLKVNFAQDNLTIIYHDEEPC